MQVLSVAGDVALHTHFPSSGYPACTDGAAAEEVQDSAKHQLHEASSHGISLLEILLGVQGDTCFDELKASLSVPPSMFMSLQAMCKTHFNALGCVTTAIHFTSAARTLLARSVTVVSEPIVIYRSHVRFL